MAMVLETIIENVVSATFVREASIAATKDALHEDIDFAFLDFDVTNGKTFEIARILQIKCVPYVFVSASCQASQLTLYFQAFPPVPDRARFAVCRSLVTAGSCFP